MTPEIRAQWSRNQSRLTRRWVKRMFARRKVRYVEIIEDNALRERVLRTANNADGRQALFDDLLLVEAALATDRTVASLDESVRALFRRATDQVGELRTIVWVNPELEDEEPIPWLERGAPAEPERMLGVCAVGLMPSRRTDAAAGRVEWGERELRLLAAQRLR